jgi:hypothetical protein
MYKNKTILINSEIKKQQNGINLIISNLSNEMSIDVLNLTDISTEKNIKYYLNFFRYFPILFILFFYNKNHFKSFIVILKVRNFFCSYKDYNLIFFGPHLTFCSIILKKYLKNNNNILYKIDSLLVYYDSFKKYNFKTFFRFFIEKLIIRFSDSRFNSVIYVNERDLYNDSRFNKYSNFEVIPNGVNINEIKVQPKTFITKNIYSFSFHGDLTYYPNKECCDLIFLSSFFQNEKFKINLYGKHNGFNLINRFNIQLHGFVNDINEVFDNDFYISLIFKGSGMKNKALEALSSGIMIIASVETFNGINGCVAYENYFPIHQEKDIDKQLSSALFFFKSKTNEQLAEITKNNRFLAQKYSWESTANKLNKLFQVEY